MLITVGISQFALSSDPEDELVTYSLGSCLGVAIYDPVVRVGGMIHTMLPRARLSRKKADCSPAMFTDRGVPLLLRAMLDHGAVKERLVIKAAGCANAMENDGIFQIGRKNYMVFRKVMWSNSLMIAARDVGGNGARTMYLSIADGTTRIRSQGKEIVL